MFFWEEKMIEICFCMKGIMFISIVLEVIDFELDNFEVQLFQKVVSVLQFFICFLLILYLIKFLFVIEFELLVVLCC